jgi:choline kinase
VLPLHIWIEVLLMRKQAFILAAGEQQRWPKDAPPKQLLHVGEERIILRMVRQVRQRRMPVITVALNDEIVEAGENPIWFPDDNSTVLSTMLSTQEAWRGQTIVLLGDVIYSKAAMDAIVAFEGRLRVFGNRQQAEVFAVSFSADAQDEVVRLTEQAIEYWLPYGADRVKIGGFYRAAVRADQGIPLQKIDETEAFFEIDDYTNDVDSEDDYRTFIADVVKAGKLDDLPPEVSL